MRRLLINTAFLSSLALMAGAAQASSPGAWSAHDKEVAAACVKASGLKNAKPAGQPMAYDDSVGMTALLVAGRYPQAHVVTAQAQAPRLVTVPSPSQDISRSHLEVRLEGWNVLLVDLTTVNGTTLLRPGQPPRRLHPQEPTLVVSGDVADLGDGVRLTFEGVA